MKHHDVGELVGHAFGRVELPHMVEFNAVMPGGFHTGLLAKFAQRGLFNVLSPVDESGRQTVGESIATDTIFTFDQVPVVRAIMHQHDHARRVAHHLPTNHRSPATTHRQCNPHVVDAENSALVHVLAVKHRYRAGHVHSVTGLVQQCINLGFVCRFVIHDVSSFLSA